MNQKNRAKMVYTIGPSSSDPQIIEKLIDAGMNVARFNFSHGEYSHFLKWFFNVRAMAHKRGRSVAIMQDLQGPRIRVGRDLPEEGIELTKGDMVNIGYGPYEKNFIPIDYKNIVKDIKKGTQIFLVDGLIKLEVVSINDKKAKAKVLLGGKVFPHKGVNIPNVVLSISAITEKDKNDLLWGIRNGIDLVALSFVRNSKDIKELREIIHSIDKNSQVQIIAKIEKPEAVADIENILKEADGIMIARGDLGIEIPVGEIPIIQKKLILKALEYGKPVITATQMMESMIHNPSPTRAEVSDIANAILDGTDAVMLSGETANGDYPVQAAYEMSKTINKTEEEIFNNDEYWFDYLYRGEVDKIKSRRGKISPSDAIGYSAREIALDVGAKYIVVATITGNTARMISRNRPKTPIVSVSPNEKLVNKLSLLWGINSYYSPFSTSTNEWIKKTENLLKKEELVKKGDVIVMVAAYPFDIVCHTNLIRVHTIE